jgi:hypothetical protein
MKFQLMKKITHKISIINEETKEYEIVPVQERELITNIDFPYEHVENSIKSDLNKLNLYDEFKVGDRWFLMALPQGKPNFNPWIHHEFFRQTNKRYEFRFLVATEIKELSTDEDGITNGVKFVVNTIHPFFYRLNKAENTSCDVEFDKDKTVRIDDARFQGDIIDYMKDDDSSTFDLSNADFKYFFISDGEDVTIDFKNDCYSKGFVLKCKLDGYDIPYMIYVNNRYE